MSAGFDALAIEPDADGSRFGVRVKPSAKRSRIQGVYGERLKVEVAAPPERGKANAAVIELIATRLSVGRDQVTVVAGHTSQDKVLRVAAMSPASVRSALQERL